MLTEWSEIGIGRHFVEEAVLSTASFLEYENLKEEFKKLNELTEKHGTKYALGEREGDGSCTLRITVLSDVLKRNAGPRRKKGSLKRISEVFSYMESGKSSQEGADFAGVRLRSFQRRVKKYKEEGKWGRESQGFF